ncbi:MAG: peptide chain release factor N(5)-glutamine methyltransferase [Clostridia bacterium]|nr:peptide chain release factor N(5)-glutamine methyltransferase [Clostridia bacterium]
MIFSELYSYSKNILLQSGNDSSVFESSCLMKKFFDIDRLNLSMHRNEIPDKHLEDEFLNAVKKRASGYPLQYILGKWDFMGSEFFVGEGVLIPRDDTEVVVNACINALKNTDRPVIIDLCSGSGAIAVTLAKEFPDSTIYALELSDKAFEYLEKNIEHNNVKNIIKIKDDIFNSYDKFSDGFFDAIISNPPYIRTDVIKTLQTEVQSEPVTALDGGSDGLDFYRVIAEKWTPKLKKGGKISLEIGEEQAESVLALLKNNKISYPKVIKDIQNLDRVILGTKK